LSTRDRHLTREVAGRLVGDPPKSGARVAVVVSTVAELREQLRGSRVVLIPTMGALHDGHLSLVHAARDLVRDGAADTIVASIFVNPLQFAAGEDLADYPRSFESDVVQLSTAGVSHVFAPSVDEMYPKGTLETNVTAGAIGRLFEGSSRAGHFDGVLTVVAKLINIASPVAVVFGQKDAQQVFLVRQMVEDLSIPTRIVVVDTVRDADGLALSSRNAYLDATERRAARLLSVALKAAASRADHGAAAVLAAGQGVFGGEPLVQLEYFAVVDPTTFRPVDDDYLGAAMALVAARVGTTRLIDNALFTLA
jgi:pantoate--beta-alanine ligase